MNIELRNESLESCFLRFESRPEAALMLEQSSEAVGLDGCTGRIADAPAQIERPQLLRDRLIVWPILAEPLYPSHCPRVLASFVLPKIYPQP